MPSRQELKKLTKFIHPPREYAWVNPAYFLSFPDDFLAPSHEYENEILPKNRGKEKNGVGRKKLLSFFFFFFHSYHTHFALLFSVRMIIVRATCAVWLESTTKGKFFGLRRPNFDRRVPLTWPSSRSTTKNVSLNWPPGCPTDAR